MLFLTPSWEIIGIFFKKEDPKWTTPEWNIGATTVIAFWV